MQNPDSSGYMNENNSEFRSPKGEAQQQLTQEEEDRINAEKFLENILGRKDFQQLAVTSNDDSKASSD